MAASPEPASFRSLDSPLDLLPAGGSAHRAAGGGWSPPSFSPTLTSSDPADSAELSSRCRSRLLRVEPLLACSSACFRFSVDVLGSWAPPCAAPPAALGPVIAGVRPCLAARMTTGQTESQQNKCCEEFLQTRDHFTDTTFTPLTLQDLCQPLEADGAVNSGALS